MTHDSNFKVLVVVDDPFIAEDLQRLLMDADYLVEVLHKAAQLVETLSAWKPDLVLLDINLGAGASGIDIARWINANHPIPFVYLTSYADQNTLKDARETFPGGYLLKPFTGPDVLVAIEIAMSNFYKDVSGPVGLIDLNTLNSYLQFPLSEREYDILAGLTEGLSNKGLAEKLFISENTVKTHLQHIFEKLNVKSRTEAIARIRQIPLG
jgi:DNA-binding NarL/FixJ family response regulator